MCSSDIINISIILPVYNRQEMVKQSIQSVLNQTYPHFELIVVDDASTDNSKEIIRALEDPRIRLIEHLRTQGAPTARNTGIDNATHEWIAFQDSDDYWHPDKLEKQVHLLNIKLDNNEASPVIYTGFYRYRDGKKEYIPEKDGRTKQGDIHKALLLGNFISTQTVLLSKAAVESAGGFAEDMPRFQDWELWLRLSRKHPFFCVDEPLVEVHYTEGSISSAHSKLLYAYDKIIEKHELLFRDAGPHYFANLLFSYGHNLCLAGEMKKGRDYLIKSLYNQPSLIKIYASYITSLLGKKIYQKIYAIYNR